MPVERSELQLVWPPALFATEAQELLDADLVDEDTMGWLLSEAFAGDRGYRLFAEFRRAKLWGAFGSTLENLHAAQLGQLSTVDRGRAVDPAAELVGELVRDAHTLPRYRPRRYYSQRRQPPQPAAPSTLTELKPAFAAIVGELDGKGFALARVLEGRRPLVEATLARKDARALFQIANEFDLRHRGASGTGRAQREDYDDAFLDWVYWWYLATVELTDRLLAEQGRTL